VPTSHHAQVSKILDAIVHTNPKSVLDIGTGFGKYGVLCREYLELWDGREDYQKFTRRIDGIEIFPQYLTPIHKYVYDEVFVGDALDIVPNKLQRDYDLALLIDVLEHLKKEDGAKLLGALLKRAKNVIISVPRDIGDQGTVFGNEHETPSTGPTTVFTTSRFSRGSPIRRGRRRPTERDGCSWPATRRTCIPR